ncbi:isochorismatase family protein [Corynebacterium sp. YSMAA1_1_F7]|uniref:isochorismatase family protein n=1 Tax=Corynebacterium sp. YSMAA1_1_F7 TaxID=3383590 RepID=UPI0038D13EA5
MSNKCLLVVDVQNGFISDYTSKCLPFIYDSLQSGEFDLVVATRFYNPEGSPFRKQIHWEKLVTAHEIALDPEVEQRADVIIDKPTYTAGQALLDVIADREIDEVVVMGIDTDVCVLVNSALLFDNGITVTIDIRGCATNGGPDAEEAARKLLKRYIGWDYVIE